nr:TRAP transporter small permease [uncultured Cohaesibacter sp.]
MAISHKDVRKKRSPIDYLSSLLGLISMWGVPIVVCVIFYEVTMRYVFVSPTLWANELSLWICGGVYLLAGVYAMRKRAHIRITVIYDISPRWLQHVFDVISVALLALYVLALVWGSYTDAVRKLISWETFGTAWDPPIPATLKPLLLIAFVLMAVQALSNLIMDWKDGESES